MMALKESINNDYAQFHVFRFLNKLKEVDSGFKFHVYKADDNSATGYVYQTSDMRRIFECYGNFLSLDMMKRKQNDLRWPYFGTFVVDGSNRTLD